MQRRYFKKECYLLKDEIRIARQVFNAYSYGRFASQSSYDTGCKAANRILRCSELKALLRECAVLRAKNQIVCSEHLDISY